MLKNRRHRGADPEDEHSFGDECWATLRRANSDLCWLLDHGYAIASAAELVGDRYALTKRQRLAVARCACSGEAKERRLRHRANPPQLRDQELWIDGFNVLTAIETALAGGVILVGRDGCCRDVAGIHRRYHKVMETIPALRTLGAYTSQWGVRKCRWWLDRPVNNSGRLKGIIHDVAAKGSWAWEVELVPNPDRVLSETAQIACSSDHVILDRCQRWANLARLVIGDQIPQARVVDLSLDACCLESRLQATNS